MDLLQIIVLLVIQQHWLFPVENVCAQQENICLMGIAIQLAQMDTQSIKIQLF